MRRCAEGERPADKTSLGAFTPARFDGLRRKRNVIDVCMLAVDFDDVPAEIGNLAIELPYRKLIYETYSPAREGRVRWRVVFPLARPVNGEDWDLWWASAVRDLGLSEHVDQACKDASHLHFLPCGGAGVYELDGPMLDPNAIGRKRAIRVGERNTHMHKVASSARARGLDHRAMLAAENARLDLPLEEEELERIAKSVDNYAEGNALNDIGNASRFARLHAAHARWSPGLGWLAWDGTRWQRDDRLSVIELAKETARSYYVDASAALSEGSAKRLAKHAQDSSQKAKLDAMLSLSRSHPDVVLAAESLDADPWLLNVVNGSIDLRTGVLREHRRNDACSKIAGCVWDPKASCERFSGFMSQCVPDEDEREFLRRWVGYSLTGHTGEHALAFLHGPGRNGKSVFLETVSALLGEYATKAPAGILDLVKGQKHPTELMGLRRARLAWCAEVDQGVQWNESRVKDLASSDPITAHYMRQDYVTFEPTHKLWIAGNHRPRIVGTDDAIWARLRLIPFDVVIPESARDAHLPTKLRAELPGILRWAVEGCLAWQRSGLGTSKIVQDATRAYRDEQDVLGRFLEEECATGASLTVESSKLYDRFSMWAERNRERRKSTVAFALEMTRRGFAKKRTNIGAVWSGVGFPEKKYGQ